MFQTVQNNETVGVEDVKNMPYLEATVQEAMRIANIGMINHLNYREN